MPHFLSVLLDWIAANKWIVPLTGAVAGVLAVVLAVARLSRELRNLATRIDANLSGRIGLYPDVQATHQVHYGTEVELLTHRHTLPNSGEGVTCPETERPLVACQVLLVNRDRVPVDVVACLAAAREVGSDAAPRYGGDPGIGLGGRGLLWDDLPANTWNTPEGLFSGLSTTASIFQPHEHVVRLQPGEADTLLRLDAITSVPQLLEQQRIHLLYKLFTVVIRPDPQLLLKDASPRQLRETAHDRWRSLKNTMDGLGRTAFRYALQGAEAAARAKGQSMDLAAGDPLGELASARGWRCFLLHHWDFEARSGNAPSSDLDEWAEKRQANGEPSLDEYGNRFWKRFNDDAAALYCLSDERRAQLAAQCATDLKSYVDAWTGLLTTIRACKEIGWTSLVREEPYKRRYKALKDEGYLFEREDLDAALRPRGLRRLLFGRAYQRLRILLEELPASDPLGDERFVMRIRHVLATIDAKHPQQSREAQD